MTGFMRKMRPAKHRKKSLLTKIILVLLALLTTLWVLALALTLGTRSDWSPSSMAATVTSVVQGGQEPRAGSLGVAGGDVPSGTTLKSQVPAVHYLSPDLREAMNEAADDAAKDDIKFIVNSGWRSEAFQQQLLDEAVDRYGSKREAARWVATAQTSPHVSGNAIDIGSYDARAWLDQHGRYYGLCTVYENEPWHFELRPEAVSQGCPAPYTDPTEDPRLQR
ncbi:M15 family metallopeptidase [Glutamicibacter creatinolyticus]|uniref:M15 family metallopeptidase n=1 Tax=Glutamicibacter creatinolyticus TaxID=162496 RepID=UPI0031DFDF86